MIYSKKRPGTITSTGYGFKVNSFVCRCIILLGLLAVTSVSYAQAPNNRSDVNWLIDVLKLSKGSVAADIGAGDADQAVPIAKHLGPSGKLYATELESGALQELRDAVKKADVDNITVVKGHPMRTNLPAECCDALYMRRVYHHFKDPETMNQSLLATLKPGGRIAVIDFEPRESEAQPADRASGGSHGVTNETVVNELRKAGFKLISSEQPFGRDIYVVMEKPEEN